MYDNLDIICGISDSGIESSTAVAFEEHHRRAMDSRSYDDDDESPPSLDTAIQRLAETIKEFDVHSGNGVVNGNGKMDLTDETLDDETISKSQKEVAKNGNGNGAGKEIVFGRFEP